MKKNGEKSVQKKESFKDNVASKEKEMIEEKINELEILKQSLEEKKAQAQMYWDQILRLKAEFENYRKRVEIQKKEYIHFGKSLLMEKIFPILETTEKALLSIEDKNSSFYKGFEMVYKQLWKTLQEEGLERQDVLGKVFDPMLHEVVDFTDDEEKPEGLIIEEVSPGYMLSGRLLRPAKVKIIKKKNKSKQEDKKEEKDGKDNRN